jgi:tetratricopeptide (TPR) repeat protein
VFWLASIIGLALLVTYWNGLSGPFVYDDQLTIVGNPHIRHWWRLQDVLSAEQDSPTAGRPLVGLSFALDYRMAGLDVRAYHVSNLAIHLLCALVVFGVVRRTFELPAIPSTFRVRSTGLAFSTALLWALHPLNSEVVEYVTQRTESMMALFYLLTIYGSVRSSCSERPARWQTAAVATCAFGMACKESMATAPLVVVLYDRIYTFDSFKNAFLKRWRFYAALAATWLLLAALMRSSPRGESAGFTTDVRPWTYLLNQTIMITEYLRHTLWPRSLVAGYGWALPLTPAEVAPCAMLIVILLLLAGLTLVVKPKLGFLGAWFFITLAPSSSLVPIATEVGAERRMYLPLAALVLLAVIGATFVCDAVKHRWFERPGVIGPGIARYGGIATLVVVSAALAAGTIARNREYASVVSLARTVVERWPTSLGHHILGSALMAAGSHEEAVVHLRAALPDAPRAYYDLGAELFNEGKLNEAIEPLEALIKIWKSPPFAHPHWQAPVRGDVIGARLIMGRAFAQQDRWREAAEQCEQVLAMMPSNIEARKLLATVLFSERSFDLASVHYKAYLESRPNDVDALTNLGIALVAAGQDEEAFALFRRAVDVDPANGRTRRNLANALFDHGDVDEAAVQAARAVALRPDDPAASDLLGQVLAVQGKFDEAAIRFKRSLQLDPTYEEARGHLDRIKKSLRN